MNFLHLLFGNPEKEQEKELLQIIYSPRLRGGWRVQWHPNGTGILTVPAIFQKPEYAATIKELREWAELVRQRKSPQRREKIRSLELRIRSQMGESLPRLPLIHSVGTYHDLQKQFEVINEKYFAGKLQCEITWSSRKGGLSYHTLRQDRRTGEKKHFISISKGYDAPNCPDYAIQGILYHECLHALVPVEIRNGRRVVHGSEFRRREKLFTEFDLWRKFHKEVLPMNIRDLKKRKSKSDSKPQRKSNDHA